MKTNAITWSSTEKLSNGFTEYTTGRINTALRSSAKLFAAAVPALAVLVTAVWAVQLPLLLPYLNAATWAGGFVFMALAIESERTGLMGLLLGTGMALSALALLSDRLAPEFAVVAAALAAFWLAAWIFRR